MAISYNAFDEKGLRQTAVLIETATLNFPSVAANVGVQNLTITVAGAAAGDPVALALPAAINSGLIFNAFVSAADTVTVRCTNITAGAIDPASAAFTVAVIKP